MVKTERKAKCVGKRVWKVISSYSERFKMQGYKTIVSFSNHHHIIPYIYHIHIYTVLALYNAAECAFLLCCKRWH